MQEMSAPESTSAEESTTLRVFDGVISCIGILIDFGDEETRTGEMVVVDHCRGTLGNIRSMASARGDV